MTHLLQLQTMPAEAGGTEQIDDACSIRSTPSLLLCPDHSNTSLITCHNLAEF